MKKKNVIWPQYVKNAQGKTTQVYLPLDAYEAINKEFKEYEKIQKTEGVKWVQVSPAKRTRQKIGKKK